MNEQNHSQVLAESISALIDNQASALELQRILKVSEQDASVKATWVRYQLVGAFLRGEQAGLYEQAASSSLLMPDFASRVSAEIAAEDQPAAVTVHKTPQGLWHQLGRVALVASVAGGMIFSVQQFNHVAPSGATEMASINTVAPAAVPSVSLPSGLNGQPINTRNVAMQTGYETRPQENRRVTFQPRLAPTAATATAISDEELTRYVNQMIQAHSDNAAMNSGQGVLPYARVIITEEE